MDEMCPQVHTKDAPKSNVPTTLDRIMAESCHEQMSFESGFKQRKGRSISEIGWQRVPDRRCKKAEETLPERFGVTLWDFEDLNSHTMNKGFVLVHMHIESEKDNLVQSRQKKKKRRKKR